MVIRLVLLSGFALKPDFSPDIGNQHPILKGAPELEEKHGFMCKVFPSGVVLKMIFKSDFWVKQQTFESNSRFSSQTADFRVKSTSSLVRTDF